MGISFDDIWNKIIWENLGLYSDVEGLRFCNDSKLKKDIKKNFDFFTKRCKERYMNPNSVKILDRHKIATCLMYAILETNLYETYPQSRSSLEVVIITEQIAISVGLSVLRTYIVDKFDSFGKEKDKATWEKDKAIFKNGFILPGENADDVNHGEYRNNLAMALYFTKIDGTYNILSLSNSLYLLEMYNRHLWDIKILSKQIPPLSN